MNLASLTAALLSFVKKFTYGERFHPQRDWLILIGISGIILVISTGWSYWVFHQASTEADTTTQGGNGTLNTATLESVTAIFEKRAAERAHYINDYRFVDPSH